MMTTSMSNGGNGQMMNEEHIVHAEENKLIDEEMSDEGITDEEDLSDDEDITEEGLSDEDEMIDEDDMTDEELTLITKIQIALVGILFGMAIMGLLVYATTPAFRFFI